MPGVKDSGGVKVRAVSNPRPAHLNAVFGLDPKLNPSIFLAGLDDLRCVKCSGST